MQTLKEIGLLFWAIINNWAGYSTGGVIMAIVAFWHLLKNRPVPRKLGIGLAIFFFVLSFFKAWQDQYRRAGDLQARLNMKNAPEVQINIPQQPSPQVQVNVPPPVVNIPFEQAYFGPDGAPSLGNYSFGKYVAVTGNCKNFSSWVAAEDAMCWMRAFAVDTKLNTQQQPIVPQATQDEKFAEFQKSLSSLRKGQRTTVGPGESHFGTVSPGILDEKLDAAFRTAKKTILFAAEYNWRDRAGWHTDELCMWLQLGTEMPPLFSGPGSMIPNAETTWNRCINHNGLIGTPKQAK
jgi:hypothetical protein